MTSFYTRTGDEGTTGVLGKTRLPKDDERIEALGAIDELSSVLGLARSSSKVALIQEIIVHIQRDLFGMMSELAATPENVDRFHLIHAEQVDWLEERISYLEQVVVVPSYFILAGDLPSAAALDLARTVTRRAERRVVSLTHHVTLPDNMILKYLNRLSSLCFILELHEMQQSGVAPLPANEAKH